MKELDDISQEIAQLQRYVTAYFLVGWQVFVTLEPPFSCFVCQMVKALYSEAVGTETKASHAGSAVP